MASSAALLREVGREPLVEALDRHVDHLTQERDERLRLGGLLAVQAAHRQRQANDHALRLVLADQR